MPELPEVETIRSVLEADIIGARLEDTVVTETRLRRTVPRARLAKLRGWRFAAVGRRAKYLLLWMRTSAAARAADAAIVVHLGMSGRVDTFRRLGTRARPHDHVRWVLRGGTGGVREMRFNDPRRFGLVLPLAADRLFSHALFRELGPEPLGPDFTAAYFGDVGRRSRREIKALIMDARVVVGVGNIYASEALWRAGIHPRRRADRISAERYTALREAIVDVLGDAIRAGGTTLNDYRDPQGNRGYFRVELDAYGRESEPCRRCGDGVRRIVQQARATYYCAGCQR